MKIPKNLDDINTYIVIQAQREIGVQINFALAAFNNITKKGEGNAITTHSSIHSFLTHCANISKLLWSEVIKIEIGKDIVEVIGAPSLPLLKDRTFRNDLDHYDERLVSWIKDEYPKHRSSDPSRRPVSDLTIGDKAHIGGPNALHLRNYDPLSKVYTYGDRELNLEEMRKELIELQKFIGGPTVRDISS